MRIGIVNDIKMTIEVLRRTLSNVPEYEIAWIALNGEEALKKCLVDKPDLILMDLLMPIMGGVEATSKIMKSAPCPILIVTSSVSSRASLIFEAMGNGALDVVRTPSLDSLTKNQESVNDLLRKIEVIGRLTGKGPKNHKKDLSFLQKAQVPVHAPPLLVMGASTGGPIALAKILSKFPDTLPLATLIIQHVDEEFAPGLCHWLGKQTSLPVQIAFQGCKPMESVIMLAGKNSHMILNKNLELEYTQDPKECIYHPSVDVFFQSIAKNWPDKSVAVLLTGMGSDGALGLKMLKDAGWYTIAESEKTSVVYGMPRAAVEMGAATDVLPLEEIPGAIMAYLKNKKGVTIS